MTANLRRGLAVGLTAALAFIGLLTVPAHSAPASTPSSCAGVWVVVQSDDSNPASAKIGCATDYSTGLAALQSAGFTPTGTSFISQIDGVPTNPDWVTNGNLWWSHWTAPVSPDGTLGAWTGFNGAATVNSSAPGTAEGWRVSVTGAAGPAVTKVFAPATSTSAPASTSASTTTSTSAPTSSASTSASASASSVGTRPASAAAVHDPEVVKAAGFLSNNLPTADDGTGTFVGAALALSAARSCTYSSTIASLIASIKAQAADYVGTDAPRAASLTIAAIALGEDPTSFGGLNLLSILAAGTQPDGQVGAYASSYSQALAVIAYVRAGQPVPAAVLANLVAGQDPTGAFGYTYGGIFYPDYDTTGLAIEALSAAHGDSAVIAKAIAWALSEQTQAGYWPNPYSPVDSTGILGSGLEFAGTSAGAAAAWLKTQQLADGGFPASVDITTSNIMATANAMWLLAGSNLVTVSTLQCPASTTGPTATSSARTADPTLADTGAPDDGPIGALAVAMLVVGVGALVLRRRQRQA